MRAFLRILIVGVFFFSCSVGKHSVINDDNNRDGSSYEKAIVINETGETSGVADEYAWLKEHYPGYHFKQQSLCFSKKGEPYDVLSIITAEGKDKLVYFDISKFFGKL
jgi:hypothetical protein